MTRTQKIAWEWAVQWCALKRCLTECRMLQRSSGAFRSFWVSGKYSGMRSGGGGTHRKDTGNIGNNRGTWEMTGVPLTVLYHCMVMKMTIPICAGANGADNASSNGPLNCTISKYLWQVSKVHIDPQNMQVGCGGHVLDISSQCVLSALFSQV